MSILTINSGSTSTKYTFFFKKNKKLEVLSKSFTKKDKKYFFENIEIKEKCYVQHFSFFLNFLIEKKYIKNIKDINAFGIRIVHGADIFKKTTLLNQKNFLQLKKNSVLAPLHNPPAIHTIEQIKKLNSKAKVYGIFDTSFHQTIPDFASTYAIPRKISKNLHIKKYGFHGISCLSGLRQIKNILKKIPKKIIICHLGGGSSITAIKNGKSQDTSMGFTPLEGLMMVTRAGDLDEGASSYLQENLHLLENELLDLLNKKSGFLGLTGIKDIKKIIEKSQRKDPECMLAVEIFVYRIVKYIFSYFGVLQGIDLLILSGGIGEGSDFLRKKICEKLKILGFELDNQKNKKIIYQTGQISTNSSKNIFVIKVDENLEMYHQILKIL